MEIRALSIRVTDADLLGLLGRLPPEADKIEDLQARLTPAGVVVSGKYAAGFGIKVPFETRWGVAAAGPVVRVTLDDVQVAGLPAGMIRGAIVRMMRDSVEGQPGLSVDGEALLLAAGEAAAAHGVPLSLNFTAVRFGEGEAAVEAG